MSLAQTQPPAVEPVSLDEAKLHLRQFDTAEDSLIKLMIASARRYAEAYCGRSFITQQWSLTIDAFPGCGDGGSDSSGLPYSLASHMLVFERGPVQSIDAIVYKDMGGNTVTVANPGSPEFAIDLTGAVGRMTPGFGYTWPNTLPEIGAARIDFTAGYGDAPEDVPEEIRH